MIVYDKKVPSVVHPNQPMAQETLVIGANPAEIKLPPTQDELLSDPFAYILNILSHLTDLCTLPKRLLNFAKVNL